MKTPKQKTHKTFGQYGQTIRVFRQGKLWRVQCRSLGIFQSYRGEGAKEKAIGFAEKLAGSHKGPVEAKPKVGELWDAYSTSQDFRELRARSKDLYSEAWKLFVLVVPHTTIADEVTVAILQSVRTQLETTPRARAPNGLAINTVRQVIGTVKMVFRWGERTGFLERSRVNSFVFKVGKDRRPQVPDEYSSEEFKKLLEVLSFDRLDQRSALCVLSLCGYQGIRINAVLHLRWEDVRWDDDLLLWRAQWDKQGNEWDQPMRNPTRAILGRLWEAKGRPESGWVFPSKRKDAKSPVYTSDAFIYALHAAELRAGIEPRRGKASHSFRRMVAGDVVDATGSAHQAMEAIGDRSVKMAERYVKRRTGRTARSLKSLDEGAA